ncbi:hypothetical protein ACRAWC_18185 [Leifsonia sp. L25]|uniref:hypothetical protein n=1 Tax=Actinomycetes TaxID=1760 RepID=UPI003D69E67B
MNHRQYIAAMSALRYSRAGAEDLIWLSKDDSDVVLRTNNFIPRGDGLYEIWLSGDRDGFFRVSKDGRPFLGTLGEAYELIYDQVREWLDAHPDARRNSE